ncbi:hypothetical protein L1987_37888 [Smallanthus sonchifolius]|uniref:Uncharacterized protein n=1 Tax=Smallanthus sonchifolius TaxID=185202 RepID=A0ACB9HHE2_9ASTR|nr:hypothetical protein L1987_37888 [Smallanthus sonchifolius]
MQVGNLLHSHQNSCDEEAFPSFVLVNKVDPESGAATVVDSHINHLFFLYLFLVCKAATIWSWSYGSYKSALDLLFCKAATKEPLITGINGRNNIRKRLFTDGPDGYVSVEVSPRLADDTQGTVDAAKWLQKVVDRPYVYIKILATAAYVSSVKDVISLGISVNVSVS